MASVVLRTSLVMILILHVVLCTAHRRFDENNNKFGQQETSLGRVERSSSGSEETGPVAARTDRFFLGTRYGKRAQRPPVAAPCVLTSPGGGDATCVALGYGGLFRCFYRKEDGSEDVVEEY